MDASGTPRTWQPSDDVPAVAKRARGAAAAVLAALTVLRPPPTPLLGGGKAAAASSGGAAEAVAADAVESAVMRLARADEPGASGNGVGDGDKCARPPPARNPLCACPPALPPFNSVHTPPLAFLFHSQPSPPPCPALSPSPQTGWMR